jgi:starch-binding outer membrane protein, SusD/RagB family
MFYFKKIRSFMKNIFQYLLRPFVISLLTFFMATTACTDLEVPVESEYTEDNFPTTEAQFIAATGSIYTQLRGHMALYHWFLQELTTDEAVLPARGTNWYDGGGYMQLNLHTWTISHGFVLGTWQWGFKGVSTCNRVLSLLETAGSFEAKDQIIAEVRAMRALNYYFLMDLFGNIPILPPFGSDELPATSSQQEVFNYIESELLEVLPSLSDATGSSTYGRPNQWTIHAILAKMYLNAEAYIGQNKYTAAIEQCNALIESGKFALNGNYMDIFGIKNGPTISEIIFAVPYDGNLATGQYFARYALHPALQTKYGIPFRPSNASCTWPEFYALYNEPNDTRNQMWLAGPQYQNDGKTPVTISTTKKGLDASYSGADGGTAITYHLNFAAEMNFTDPARFDLGGDELGKAKGVRNIKYYPDNTAPARDQSNDFVLFRYADILLMKAEAILRGGADSKGETALDLVNKIRTRAGVSTYQSMDLNTLWEERSREMAWEGWRRNDLIRFGKWEDAWGIKPANPTATHLRLFPIPQNEMALNPNLVQNPGY